MLDADAVRQTGELTEVLRASSLVDPRSLPVRFHRLKALSLSAAHYFLACQAGDDLDTVAIRMGAGFHGALFGDKTVMRYEGRRAGKAWEAFERDHLDAGHVILSAREHDVTSAMIDRVRRHERAMRLLFDRTVREQTIEWSFAGRACRSTPDARHGLGGWNVDLKSTRCAEPRWFAREILRRAYHAQLAFYDDAIEDHTGKRPDESYVVAVENVPPHCVTVVRMTPEAKQLGAKLCRQWWERLLAAEAAGYYGDYVEADVDLELPDYALDGVEIEIDGRNVSTDE